MLIALLDPLHIHEDTAHCWFDNHEKAGWATCPITQNGYVRIVSQVSYGSNLSVAAAANLLRDLIARPSHEFWPDSESILDAASFDLSRLGSGRHVTDSYLLGLAKAHGGKFVTLDSRLSVAGVVDGESHLTRLL